MAITVVADNVALQNNRVLSWACGTLAVGDIIVVSMVSEDATNFPMNAPAATTVTFTSRVVDANASHTWVAVYTGVVTGAGAKTVTAAITSGNSCMHNGTAVVFPTADGYSLAVTPNTTDTRGSGGPSAAITGTTAGNIIVACNGDWSAIDGTSRTYRGTTTEDAYSRLGVGDTNYFWHQTAAAGTNTIGLSAPVGQTYTVAGVEVLFAGGAAAPIINLTMAPITGY